MKTFDQLSPDDQELAINFLVNDVLSSLTNGMEYEELAAYQDEIDELCDDVVLSDDDLDHIFYEWFDDNSNFASLVSEIADRRARHAFYRQNNDEVFDLELVLSD